MPSQLVWFEVKSPANLMVLLLINNYELRIKYRSNYLTLSCFLFLFVFFFFLFFFVCFIIVIWVFCWSEKHGEGNSSFLYIFWNNRMNSMENLNCFYYTILFDAWVISLVNMYLLYWTLNYWLQTNPPIQSIFTFDH